MPIAHRAAEIVSENTRKCPSPAVETTRPPSAASSRSIRSPVRREHQLDERLVALRIAVARHLALQIHRADDVREQKSSSARPYAINHRGLSSAYASIAPTSWPPYDAGSMLLNRSHLLTRTNKKSPPYHQRQDGLSLLIRP